MGFFPLSVISIAYSYLCKKNFAFGICAQVKWDRFAKIFKHDNMMILLVVVVMIYDVVNIYVEHDTRRVLHHVNIMLYTYIPRIRMLHLQQ